MARTLCRRREKGLDVDLGVVESEGGGLTASASYWASCKSLQMSTRGSEEGGNGRGRVYSSRSLRRTKDSSVATTPVRFPISLTATLSTVTTVLTPAAAQATRTQCYEE